MVKKESEIELARELRSKEGLSVSKIARKLNVAKSSVSVWVRDIELTEEQKQVLRNEKVNSTFENLQEQAKKRKNKYKDIRDGYVKEGYSKAISDEYFRTVCLLYWGEGTKSKNVFKFCNSDMDMLFLMCKWIDKNVNKKIIFCVSYYGENGLSEYQIKRRWMGKVPFIKNKKWEVKFIKQEIKRDSQKKGTGKLPYGTVSITICSTELIQKIYGGIDYIKNNAGLAQLV